MRVLGVLLNDIRSFSLSHCSWTSLYNFPKCLHVSSPFLSSRFSNLCLGRYGSFRLAFSVRPYIGIERFLSILTQRPRSQLDRISVCLIQVHSFSGVLFRTKPNLTLVAIEFDPRSVRLDPGVFRMVSAQVLMFVIWEISS